MTPFAKLPSSSMSTRKGRLLLAGAAGVVAILAAIVIGIATQTAPLVFGAIAAVFVLAFASLPAALVLNAQAGRALEEMRRTSDPLMRDACAARAVRVGVIGDGWIEAWLVLSRAHEVLHGGGAASAHAALAYSEEALVRAQRAPGGRGRAISPRLMVVVHLRLAFVRAAQGRVDEAERMLAGDASLRVSPDPWIRAEHARAAAIVAYKRGRFREVVDLAASSLVQDARDRQLLYAIEQSSLLRLSGGTPERAGAEAPHDAWIDALVPELRARQ